MFIQSREVTESRINCLIILGSSKYNEQEILDNCVEPQNRLSSCIENIPGKPGYYLVSIKTGYESGDGDFAEMVKWYGKA